MLQQYAHCTWATTIIKLMILALMVLAGDVCAAIIHRTLTWTTGSLSCAQISKHATALGGVRTPKECLHWESTLGEKSPAASWNRTCVIGVTVRCPNQLIYTPSPGWERESARTRKAESSAVAVGKVKIILWEAYSLAYSTVDDSGIATKGMEDQPSVLSLVSGITGSQACDQREKKKKKKKKRKRKEKKKRTKLLLIQH